MSCPDSGVALLQKALAPDLKGQPAGHLVDPQLKSEGFPDVLGMCVFQLEPCFE